MSSTVYIEKLKESSIQDVDAEENMEIIEDRVKKIILSFVFRELGFDPNNPVEKKEKGMEEVETAIKRFETNNPNITLAFDGKNWWLNRE